MTSLTPTAFATVFLIVFSSSAYAAPANCTAGDIVSRLSHCISLQASLSAPEEFAKLCNSSECSIQCYNDAIGPCSGVGISRMFDERAQKVSIRYACAHIDALLEAIKVCGNYVTTSNCMGTLINTLSNVTDFLISAHPDYDAYFKGVCSAAKTFHSCVPAMPTLTDTCTAEQAKFLNNLFNLTYSLDACGIKQDDPAFTLYDGPVMCNRPAMIG